MKVVAIYCDEDKVRRAGPGENLRVRITGIEEEDILSGFVLSSTGEYDTLQIAFITNDYAIICIANYCFHMIFVDIYNLSLLFFVVVLIWSFPLFSVAVRPVPAVTEFVAQLQILELLDNVSTCFF